jgi:hypothetical protein
MDSGNASNITIGSKIYIVDKNDDACISTEAIFKQLEQSDIVYCYQVAPDQNYNEPLKQRQYLKLVTRNSWISIALLIYSLHMASHLGLNNYVKL